MTLNIPTDQELLKAFIARRHPDYWKAQMWRFLELTTEGGREWFPQNIHKYYREGPIEFGGRLERAYRFNHTREVVDLIQKYLFKAKIERNEKDAPEIVKRFWKKATREGLNITQFMKLVSRATSIFGMPWIFTDSTKSPDSVTVADEKKADDGVYAYIVKPYDILDMGFDDVGNLLWVKIREIVRDDDDPFRSSGELGVRYKLWTKDAWVLFEEVEAGNRGTVIRKIGEGENPIKEIPGFPISHVIGDSRYSAPGLIDDIAFLDKAIANYLSNLDQIIQDQTFSQLVMPAQALEPGDETNGYEKLREMGTKRVLSYDAQNGAQAPEYISPDPKQAGVIIQVINKIINEIYHTVGMAGERTKEDNAVGIDNSSGVAKAYDFEKVNSLLASKADALENAEEKLARLVQLWASEKVQEDKDWVKYPDTFDTRSLFDEFTIAEKLLLVDAPEGVRRQQMTQVIDKLFPRLAEDLLSTLQEELKSWPMSLEEEANIMAEAKAKASPPPSARNPQTQNRQGQVTRK